MGITKTAAALAALVAAVSIGLSPGAHSRPDDGQPAQTPGDSAIHDMHARYAVRGQAWAAELFGRRYGRHLMAAVSPETSDGEAGA